MGYDYEICYNRGKENVAADALSRVSSHQLSLMALSVVSSDLLSSIQQSWDIDPHCKQLITQIQANPSNLSKYS